MISSNSGPMGFYVLKNVPRLYYRVEEDGGVLVTGIPKKCIFNLEVVSDDGKRGYVSGGLKVDGSSVILFGDHARDNRRYPLRWVELSKAEHLPPPKARRNKPGVHPWKEAKKKLDKARSNLPKEIDYGTPSKGNESQWVPKATYDEMERDRNKLRAALKNVESQIANLKAEAETKIAGMKTELMRRTNARSVHLEATLVDTSQIEGHETARWEVGDNKYLVIAETPKGLGRGNWTEDITKALDKIRDLEDIAVACVPQGSSVRVVELIPLADEKEIEGTGQF